MMKEVKDTKVYVAMSGGVDSSLSAALLQEQGYDVTGIFIKVWQPDFLVCDWRKERRDAMRVAAGLGIPFKTFDLSDAYKKDVVDYMIAEYESGRTPNPDVMCNKSVKFGAFWETARKEGADMIATGHYARVRHDEASRAKLLVGKDKNKDQSYFLWSIKQEVLQHTLFPVGELKKDEVRKEAERRDLHVAGKKDSQGICFLGDISMREFLKHYTETKPGDVLDTSGKVVGTHEGALLYTIGQRHGFEVTKKGPHSGPHYVVAKDIGKNTITVSESFKEDKVYTIERVTLEGTHWIAEVPSETTVYEARYRYRQPLLECTIEGNSVHFKRGQRGVAKGQSLVLYENEICLGGGVIAGTS